MIIQLYSKPNCTFCDQAKTLLASKGLFFEEIQIDVGQMLLEGKSTIQLTEFKLRFPGVSSVPLIIINGQKVGGFTQLKQFFESQASRQILLDAQA